MPGHLLLEQPLHHLDPNGLAQRPPPEWAQTLRSTPKPHVHRSDGRWRVPGEAVMGLAWII